MSNHGRQRAVGKGMKKTIFVLFGASGNLSSTRLIPALERLRSRRGLHIAVVGVDARPLQVKPRAPFRFVQGDLRDPGTYKRLGLALRDHGSGAGPEFVFYHATRPELFPIVIRGIRASHICARGSARARAAVEKPFGLDQASARALQRELDLTFSESQVYRVDHYLEKGPVRQLYRIRSKYHLDRYWNAKHVKLVSITADEAQGVDGRGEFYDTVGAVRDMVQNHLLQLLCAVASVSPRSPKSGFQGGSLDVLGDLSFRPGDAVFGQYRGYKSVDGVDRGSVTPTFFAARFYVDNVRWRGVPFFLRTGKELDQDSTEVRLMFRKAHRSVVRGRGVAWNEVALRLDPTESIDLVLRDGRGNLSSSTPVWSPRRTPSNEHDLVLGDLLGGRRNMFVGRGFNEAAWRFFDRLAANAGRTPLPYDPGTAGPRAPGKFRGSPPPP